MKSICVFCVCLLAVMSCARQEIGMRSETPGQELYLGSDHAVHYKTRSAEALQVRLEHVRESRCPSDVTCVTYGQAVAALRVRDGNGTNQLLTMCLGECSGSFNQTDTATFVAHAATYRVVLLEINPYPDTGQPADTKKDVKLQVDRL